MSGPHREMPEDEVCAHPTSWVERPLASRHDPRRLRVLDLELLVQEPR